MIKNRRITLAASQVTDNHMAASFDIKSDCKQQHVLGDQLGTTHVDSMAMEKVQPPQKQQLQETGLYGMFLYDADLICLSSTNLLSIYFNLPQPSVILIQYVNPRAVGNHLQPA